MALKPVADPRSIVRPGNLLAGAFTRVQDPITPDLPGRSNRPAHPNAGFFSEAHSFQAFVVEPTANLPANHFDSLLLNGDHEAFRNTKLDLRCGQPARR